MPVRPQRDNALSKRGTWLAIADATNDYFLPAFRGASYRSPIGHCPARLFKSSTGKNRQNFKSSHLSELLGSKQAGTDGLRFPLRWGLKQNLMGSADCEPTFGLVLGRSGTSTSKAASARPRAGAVTFGRSLSGTGRIRPLAISKQFASKTQFNGVGRLRTYISFTHSAC
jgi:hypothetical protein